MRQGSYAGNLTIEILIVVGIVVFANLISLRFFARADMTEQKLFSVTESTQDVLRDLDDVVNIKVYFSRKLPPYLTTLTREVRDILDEYRAYAGGNLVVDFEDPAEDPETERSVRALGIPQVQLNIIEEDKAEVMNGYLGIAVLYEDRSEVIPVVQSAVNLEYDLTAAIVKVASPEERVVGFLTPGGAQDLENAYRSVRQALERQYRVESVSLAPGAPIPEEINTLVVAGYRARSDWERFALDQFLMGGGQALFLVDMVEIPEGTLSAAPAETGLDSLLTHYGVRLNSDLVLDRSCGNATFSTGMFRYTVPYMLWPLVGKPGFNDESPITNQLELAVFPWTSSMIPVVADTGAVRSTVLARSSDRSWSERGRLNINPQREFKPPADAGPRILALLLGGTFSSFFADRDLPQPEGVDWEGAVLERSGPTQVAVVGNSRFIEADFLGQYPENAVFFMNLVDWLTLGDSLIGIRSRMVDARPIDEISEGTKSMIRFAATFGVPLALIVWGLARRTFRRRKAHASTRWSG
jgi:gliding-associated putative ABC transporter substrate-binding component GldG